MKVYIVYKAYWMYSPLVYKVFFRKKNAIKCVNELLKQPDVRSYFMDYKIEDFDYE